MGAVHDRRTISKPQGVGGIVRRHHALERRHAHRRFGDDVVTDREQRRTIDPADRIGGAPDFGGRRYGLGARQVPRLRPGRALPLNVRTSKPPSPAWRSSSPTLVESGPALTLGSWGSRRQPGRHGASGKTGFRSCPCFHDGPRADAIAACQPNRHGRCGLSSRVAAGRPGPRNASSGRQREGRERAVP